MTDFLLELLSEEIPARMQAGARRDLARTLLFGLRLDGAGGTAALARARRLLGANVVPGSEDALLLAEAAARFRGAPDGQR